MFMKKIFMLHLHYLFNCQGNGAVGRIQEQEALNMTNMSNVLSTVNVYKK